MLIFNYKELALSHRNLLQSVQLQTTGQGYDVYNGTLQDKSLKVFNLNTACNVIFELLNGKFFIGYVQFKDKSKPILILFFIFKVPIIALKGFIP